VYDQYGAFYLSSVTINASFLSGNGTLNPMAKSTATGTATFLYTRGGADPGDVSPIIQFALPTGAVGTVPITLLDATGAPMAGAAQTKKEVRIEAVTATKGSSAPGSATRAVGASGNVLTPVLTFSKVSQQDCYFIFHVPSDIDATQAVHFHLMWEPGAAWTTGYYLWKLEYLVMNEDGTTLLAGTPDTISSGQITPANATTNIETEYTDDITVAADQQMVCHFYRDIADTADDIGEVTFFEFEYTLRSLGEAI